MLGETIEDRVTEVEAQEFRLSRSIVALKEGQKTITGKLDDLSGQARETNLGVRELGGRMTAIEGRMDRLEGRMDRLEAVQVQHGELLARIVAKLDA